MRNYVDWLLDLPEFLKETDIDIEKAKAILDNDHYGLEKPKERILEYLAVQKLVTKLKGYSLTPLALLELANFLARSVAKTTGVSLWPIPGGVRDGLKFVAIAAPIMALLARLFSLHRQYKQSASVLMKLTR